MNTLQLQPNAFAAPSAAARSTSTPSIDLGAEQRPGLATLVSVELRKMRDTRSGVTLMVVTAALTLLVPIIQLIVLATGGVDSLPFSTFVLGARTGVDFLLPIMVILLVTSEWGQRTAMNTFTLVPNRGRVIAAKLVASLVTTVVAFVGVLAVAALANLVSGSLGNDTLAWDIPVEQLATNLLKVAVISAMAFGFALVLLNSAAALSVFFSVTLIVPPLMYSLTMISWMRSVVFWISPTFGIEAVADTPTFAKSWAYFAANVVIWAAVPMVLGVRRIVRAEIK